MAANPTPPFIECEKMSASLPVSDLAAAVEFYVKRLGFRFGFTFGEPATFAGVQVNLKPTTTGAIYGRGTNT